MQGKTINGYTIQQPIGVGGMAEVWLAENKLGKKAAVKLLLPKLCGDAGVKARFYTEAKVMVELNHPNIRQVYDYGELDGRPVIVLEYLDGEDLKSRLKRGQHFTDDELTRWWNQMVSALNYTHQLGIIHRDIKPGNIFVNKNGTLKLLDFGIAKVRGSISDTLTGQQLGTLMYMSPEQIKDSKNVDYHTDIYSLAVTFVHLITGQKPYNSDTNSDFEISEQIVYKPLDLSGVPQKWCELLAPYLEKDPKQRPDLSPIDTPKDTGEPNSVPVEDDTIIDDTSPKKPKNETPSPPKKPRSTPTPKPVDETPQPVTKTPKTTKGISKGLIIVLVAAVVVLGAALGWLLSSRHNTKEQIIAEIEENRTEKIIEIYNKNLNELDRNLNNMVYDKDGTVGNVLFILPALDGLQEIERMENGAVFKKTGLTPCYSDRFALFQNNLREADKLLSLAIQEQADMGVAIESNTYYLDLRERQGLVRNLLRQSQQGSALKMQKPQRKK